MTDLAVVCVASRNYLAGARVLMESVRRVAPEASPFICLLDRPPAPWDQQTEPATCFFAESLGIPEWRRFAFQYQPLELACALKPHAIRHLLDRGFTSVLYLDGDEVLYSHPDPALRALRDGASVVLTPHLSAPPPEDGASARERMMLQAGVHNAGFIALRKSDVTDRFLSWWAERLRRDCIVDLASGLHVDQRWLDLVPGMFSGVHIERSPAVNTAFWTLWSHSLSDVGDTYRVDGTPLISFHFTGFDPRKPNVLSRHDRPDAVQPDPALAQLLSGYASQLERMGWTASREWGYAYDQMSDGTPISPFWREVVRSEHAALAGVADPFDTRATPDLVSHLTALEPEMRQRRLDWRLIPPPRPTRWQRFLRRYLGA